MRMRLSWDSVEKFVRLAAQLANLIELFRKVL
jgi:hypothetical protein